MKGLESFGGHHTCLVCASDSAASHCLLTVRPSFASSLARKASFPEDCPLLGRSPARWAHVDPIALIERKWFSPASSAMGEVGRGSEEHQSWCSRVGGVLRRSRLSSELSVVSPDLRMYVPDLTCLGENVVCAAFDGQNIVLLLADPSGTT
jgi:hypothetical protein